MVGFNRELRNSIDTLRLETDKQAGFHSQLAQQIRTDLEGQVGAFVSKQQHHKKVYQAAIEKEFKVKQTREQHASKAREKYESDCLRINSYTAQSTLVQGKDLEKIHLKLERAQQTVQVNENDYAQFTRVLQETMQKWEQDWKAFCDTCQDLEEERMEFMKDNMWAYANAVSTVCVTDDEVRVPCVDLSRALTDSLPSVASRARKCVSHWNNWSQKRTWKTLCEIMGQEIRSLSPPCLSTMRIPMHLQCHLPGSPRDPPTLSAPRREPIALLLSYRMTNIMTTRTTLVLALVVAVLHLAARLPTLLPCREVPRRNRRRQVPGRRRTASTDTHLLLESLRDVTASHQGPSSPFRLVIPLTRRCPIHSS